MKVSLNSFRSFAQTPDIEIKPLTIIVGENSTGKSSLLAALRFAFELADTEAASFFNVYPFDLGPFEDIVHSSGPIESRKRFSISIEKYVKPDAGIYGFTGMEKSSEPQLVKCTFFFKSNFGEIVLSSIRLEQDNDQMDYHVGESIRVTLITGDTRIEFGQDDLYSKMDLRPTISLQSSLHQLMQFRFKKGDDGYEVRDRRLDRFISLYDAFINDSHQVVASPPVRSVPKRVYTGSDDLTNNDGIYAAYDLSKIKRSDKGRWNYINRSLNKFGQRAGLFNKFDIKKLTSLDSGPFQVKVTVRGRSSAISDVGYGVSQSLPIMADLISYRGSKTALLLQQPEVHLHPRAQAELGTMFSEFISGNNRGLIVAETHSDHLIDRIRIEIREGKLEPSLVNIIFLHSSGESVEVHQLSLDKMGNVLSAPDCYREFFIVEQERVLGF